MRVIVALMSARQALEFGYRAQVLDSAHAVVVDHNHEIGNPPDAPMLDRRSNVSFAGPSAYVTR
jgi:hypothetical protein